MKIALTSPKTIELTDTAEISSNSVTRLTDTRFMARATKDMIFNQSSKFQTLNEILNRRVSLNYRHRHNTTVNHIIEYSLSNPSMSGEIVCSYKGFVYSGYNGMLISFKDNYPEIVYAILIPRGKKEEVLTEYCLNAAIGSRSFDLPEGSVLYENPKLMKVKGTYDGLRLPYKNVVRSMFSKENITSDVQIIKDLVSPKIPRSLSISQRQALLRKANLTLANLTE